MCDDIDICPGFDDNIDSDGDGVPNGCDVCLGDDATGDSDADGVCDDIDICPGFDDNADDDSDGVPDDCDICPGGDDNIDTDGDGDPNFCDVCPADAKDQCAPYLISTPEQMNAIGTDPNIWGKYFILTADINLFAYTGTAFNIIGNSATSFTGTFDGNGRTISNFTYTSTGTDYIALFGYVGTGGEIKDLGMTNVNLDVGMDSFVAPLAGHNEGMISNCYAAGSVTGAGGYVGGMVGWNEEGTLSNCYAAGSVMGHGNVGGLVGYNYSGMVSNCYAAASVSETMNVSVGGLVGYHDSGSYTSCFWNSDLNPGLNGIGNASDPNVIGESTANMQIRSTFTDYGWDFVDETDNGTNDIWRMCVDGVEYPKLYWQYILGDFVCPDGIDFIDFSVFGLAWLSEDGQPKWNHRCDISNLNDNIIDEFDLDVFRNNWLAGK